MSAQSHRDFDPVSLEIYWNRLISIADESAAALLRTSFSTIVRESNDFATSLMDANGGAAGAAVAMIKGEVPFNAAVSKSVFQTMQSPFR